MIGFLHLLIQSSICMGLWYIAYFFLLRKLTFFRWNRWYLHLSLVSSIAIPLITIDSEVPSPGGVISSSWFRATQNVMQVQAVPAGMQTMRFWQVITFLYCVGVSVMFIRLARSLLLIYKAGKSKEALRSGPITIVPATDYISNCSFFNLVFIDPTLKGTDYYDLVLQHESMHISLGHSWDKLWVLFLRVFFWFNPFIYFYVQAFEEIHEYEVDEAVAGRLSGQRYASLLFSLAQQHPLRVTNPFSKEPLAARIRMIFAPRSARVRKTFYVLFIPLFTVLVMVFSVKSHGRKQDIILREPFARGISLPPGASDTSGFFTRIPVQGGDGVQYDEIQMVFNGNTLKATIAAGAKVAFIIGDKLLTENAIKQFGKDITTTLNCPCIIKNTDAGDPLRELDGYAAMIKIQDP